MAYRFEFKRERITLDFKFFLFEAFTKIWKYDKSKDKAKANNLLYFIYLLCDIGEDNPIKDVDYAKREEEAMYYAFKTRTKKFTDKERALLDEAIKLYIKINSTQEERLLEVFDEKSAELSAMLEDETPETVTNDENGVVRVASNAKMITETLLKLSDIRKKRDTIVASIKNQSLSEKVRGQIALSPLDKGLINIG